MVCGTLSLDFPDVSNTKDQGWRVLLRVLQLGQNRTWGHLGVTGEQELTAVWAMMKWVGVRTNKGGPGNLLWTWPCGAGGWGVRCSRKPDKGAHVLRLFWA